MRFDIEKNDLRIVKTDKLLNAAMFTLLKRNNFGKITVQDICREAQISRATFYAYFADKYDFLKSWLKNIKPQICAKDENYEKTEKRLNDFLYANKSIIKNLISDADHETLGILFDFILSLLDLSDKYYSSKTDPEYVVLCNFAVGGMVCYFQWQIENKFPPEVKPINIHIKKIIKKIKEQEDVI